MADRLYRVLNATLAVLGVFVAIAWLFGGYPVLAAWCVTFSIANGLMYLYWVKSGRGIKN